MDDFSNYIYEAPGVLDENTCKTLIQYFEKNNYLHIQDKNTTILKLNQSIINDSKIDEIMNEVKNIFDMHINTYFSKLMTLYNINQPKFTTTSIDITKYYKNKGVCINQTNVSIQNNKHSQFIYIFFLNNIDNGGDICFFNNKTIKVEPGKLILFPTEWFFIYKNNIPISHDKYTLSGLFYN